MSVLPDRFLKRIEPLTESGCWIWMGANKGGRTGYGVFRTSEGRLEYAHRFSYQTLKGEIPAGLQIDHLCRVRLCVNPDHLECVTRKENILRGMAPCAKFARMTHCKRGHEMSEANTLREYSHRRCLTCRLEYEYQRNLRRRQPKFGRRARNVKTGRGGANYEKRLVHFQSLSYI